MFSKQGEKRDVSIEDFENSDLKRSKGFRPEMSPKACKGCNIWVYICGKPGGKPSANLMRGSAWEACALRSRVYA